MTGLNAKEERSSYIIYVRMSGMLMCDIDMKSNHLIHSFRLPFARITEYTDEYNKFYNAKTYHDRHQLLEKNKMKITIVFISQSVHK